ncbi:MAG TPA: butyrate kinase [Terriglobales bacterium]|nr:butyrate kinase [Terriglobales bacterium]
MPQGEGLVLAINPGSTSTKFGIYTRDGVELARTIRHCEDELAQFRGRAILDQKDYRLQLIKKELSEAGYAMAHFEAVVGRGGLLPPLASGTYLVDDAMLEQLRLARRGEHASNLGAALACSIAKDAGVSAYVVDPVSVDEWQECARISGLALVERTCLCHALNTKSVAKRYASDQKRSYESLRLVVIHMGSGVSVSVHQDGRMIDNNTGEEGPFGADRCGGLPVQALTRLCFSGRYTEKELLRLLQSSSGLESYLGTKDLEEIERRIGAGDSKASLVLDALAYQIGKEAGAMAAVLHGEVDCVVLTGGMAHSTSFVAKLKPFVEWIAPVAIYPGEDELRALADGAFRVLQGQEQARTIGECAAREAKNRPWDNGE